MVLEVPIFSQKRLDILPVPHYIVCDQTDREGDFMGRNKEVGHEIHESGSAVPLPEVPSPEAPGK